MSEFNLNKLRKAFEEKDHRIPISSWDLTNALEPVHTNDPFSWSSYNSSSEFSDVEKEINKQYSQEVDLIKKIAFPNAPKLHQDLPIELDETSEELKKRWKLVHRAMKLWEKHVSPIIIKNQKAFVILPPRYVMQPAEIKTLDLNKFANDMLVHCAALRDKIKAKQKTNEKKDIAIIVLSILLIISYFFF